MPIGGVTDVDTVGETGSQLGSDGTDIAAFTWQVLDVARNQVQPVQTKCIKPRTAVAEGKTLLCGIQASDLVGAEDLHSVLIKFQSEVDKLGSFCFVVSGPLPFRQCLHPEASRKKIPLPGCFYTYFDLVKEVSKSVPSVLPGSTLQDVANMLGVSLVQQSCGGREEVKALCAITQKLLSQGHTFSSAETIDKNFDSCVTLSVAALPSKSAVRLRGLPFQASVDDVASFMAGLNIVPGGIVFGVSAIGRRTGEAIVVLQDAEYAQLALKRHHHYLNQRYIEVYEATTEDVVHFAGNLIAEESGTQDPSGVFVLRLQGLPYRATEQEIVQFFGDAALVKGEEEGVFIVRYPDGRASGDAFVLFPSESEVEKAMAKNKQQLGHRYVDIFRSTVKEMQRVLPMTEEQATHIADALGIAVDTSEYPGAMCGSEKNCVKLRGLPWSATSEQVMEFFGPELQKEIASQGVHLVLNSQNRPTGDCYVQLSTTEAAKEASEALHKKHMGTRYIEVFQCSGDEAAHALMHRGASTGRGGGAFRGRRRDGGSRGGGGGGGGGGGRGGSGNTVKARGLPYSTTAEEIAEFFSDFSIDEKDVEIVYDNFERSTGVAFISFSTPSTAQQAIREKNRQNIGQRYVELTLS